MPMYDYRCPSCSKEEERLVKYAVRDDQTCSCGAHLNRDEIALTVSRTDMRYEPKAIMADGSRVKGNFGTLPKKNKLGWM